MEICLDKISIGHHKWFQQLIIITGKRDILTGQLYPWLFWRACQGQDSVPGKPSQSASRPTRWAVGGGRAASGSHLFSCWRWFSTSPASLSAVQDNKALPRFSGAEFLFPSGRGLPRTTELLVWTAVGILGHTQRVPPRARDPANCLSLHCCLATSWQTQRMASYQT